MHKIRKDLLKEASGNVLEIGAGTGLNFPYYDHVSSVDAVEPNTAMVNYAFENGKGAKPIIRFHDAVAEHLPFQANQFETVVGTLVFCTIPEPKLAVEEIERVAKPGAKVILFEHVKMEKDWMAFAQKAVTPLWKRLCDGCHLDRDTLKLVKESKIEIDRVDAYYDGLFITIIGHLPE
ncbi:ubiquinone biosynthesis protein [Halobacillus andaensis]|uniref:Ubiquinone biosynthesis protein n=1 Tax=Halobacillus andaensis TaxID=1176239 RepID=A0A917B8J4_HALAA|nr:class I SAM-dependent methyltransferase [Halobacillus andaensis]MBP2005301.1 ubiquinone/menaquinone biosynthesis C-methylase UbiE [Halobacillus andaensis]GGF30413.1 ubiquinone biosynthesis protein [Halobacillus andaensis]